MSNQLSNLLNTWQQSKLDTEWVLGTVYKTEGSAYRKAGAMMLINGLGQQFGMLSGGCLESDIARNARKVMLSRQPLTLVYDGSDEDDLSFQLGIGCGGRVHIMLQAITQENNLDLGAMAAALAARKSGVYHQQVGGTEARFEVTEATWAPYSHIENGWLITPVFPDPHLLVVGGGADAQPLVRLAKVLGWRVTLADPRPANARAEAFPDADVILKQPLDKLRQYAKSARVDLAVVMTHNIDLDAQALQHLHDRGLRHISLLGPRHRYRQVMESAGLNDQLLTCPVSGPAGLNIGGQLPESIALSILAECHSVLHRQRERHRQKMVAV